jgi:hypothetical protein
MVILFGNAGVIGPCGVRKGGDELGAPRQIVPSICGQRIAAGDIEPIGEGPDLSQRLLQVVRGNRRKVLQLTVPPLELA